MAGRIGLEGKNKLENQDKDSRDSLPVNILLIEDNPADVRLVQEILTETGNTKFNLEHADRLSSGLKLLAEKEFDLVLLDLILPDCSGFETFEKVQAQAPETPVVILTVIGEEPLAIKALQEGAEDYLVKDRIDNDILTRSIRYSVERKRAETALRKAHDTLEIKVQERTKELIKTNEALRAEITEFKQSKKALREIEERFASFMQHLPGAAWIKDVQGCYVYANKVAEKVFGATLGDVLGKTDDQIFPPDTASQFKENDRRVIESGQSLQTIETLPQEDGILHHSVVSKFPILDPNGIPILVGGVAIDITGWRQTEEKLALYKEIFDKSTDGIAIIDPRGYYLEQNETHRLLLGYTDEELSGNTPAIHLGEEVFSAIGQELAKAGKYRGEVISHTKMGTLVPIELSAFTVQNEKDEPICYVGMERDITERRRAEETLRRSERELSDFFENATIGLRWIGPDGRIMRVNRAELDLLGYTHEEYVGHYIAEFHADRDVINDILRRLKNGETLQNYEARLRCKDGSIKYVLIDSNVLWEDGKLIYSRCFTRDITVSKKAEERFRLVVESVPNAIVMTDQRGTITFANSQTEKLFGYTREELMGQSVEILVPERFRKNHPEYRRYFHSEPQVRPMGAGRDLFALRKDGTEFSVEIGLVPIQMDEGVVVLSYIVDITHRKQAEEQIRKSLREKEVLLKEIHHRVKNNLQIISSLLNLQSRNITGKKAREKFKESQNRVKSMALIHEKLYQSENLEGVYFQEYIRSLLKHLFSSYGVSPDKVKLKINADNMLLSIDKAIPCGLIVNEIVSNSLKYAFPREMQGEVLIGFSPNGDNYTLTVGNSGVPFPENMDFRKTKSLGLQLVCALVEQLRGTIELDRSRGTEFRITFSPQ